MSFSLHQSDCDKFQPISSLWRARYVSLFRAVSIFNSLSMLIRLIIDKQLGFSWWAASTSKVSRSEMSTNWWSWYQLRNIDLIWRKIIEISRNPLTSISFSNSLSQPHFLCEINELQLYLSSHSIEQISAYIFLILKH